MRHRREKTGIPAEEYLKSRLFDKIGIDSDNFLFERMPDGTVFGGGGFYATTEDNLRLMKLYKDGGVWEGERILSEEYVKWQYQSRSILPQKKWQSRGYRQFPWLWISDLGVPAGKCIPG